MKLIGREAQKSQIDNYFNENRSHFLAVYGRRRVGKTFLIKEYFDNQFTFGGIPFYLDQFSKEMSPAQNINELCFGKNAFLSMEYQMLFKSLFKKYQFYVSVVEAICTKNKGLTRDEISKITKLSDGGSLTKILMDLELSNFIKKYTPMEKKSKGSLFQMIDPFCLFYNNLSENLSEENHWLNHYNSPKYNNWAGYAFELICFNHTPQIKKALGINGIISSSYSWQNAEAQIDLVIDRADKVVNIFEIKYTQAPYIITQKYDLSLRNNGTINYLAQRLIQERKCLPISIAGGG